MAMLTNTFTRPGVNMSGFVAVSIVAHLLLLSYWYQSSTPQLIISSPLSVTMLQPQNVQQVEQTNTVASKSETAKPAHSNAETKTVAVTMVDESAAIAPTSVLPQIVMQLEQSRAKQPPQPQTDNEIIKPSLSLTQVREQLRGQLHKDLARHFYYPRLARKRGWQGEVLLNLKIESDGAISRVLITKSTGYSLLDDTAINTVKKIRNVKEMGQWLNGRAIEMELPVIYRLTNS